MFPTCEFVEYTVIIDAEYEGEEASLTCQGQGAMHFFQFFHDAPDSYTFEDHPDYIFWPASIEKLAQIMESMDGAGPISPDAIKKQHPKLKLITSHFGVKQHGEPLNVAGSGQGDPPLFTDVVERIGL